MLSIYDIGINTYSGFKIVRRKSKNHLIFSRFLSSVIIKKCVDVFTAMKDGQTWFVKTVIDSFAKEFLLVIFIFNLEFNESLNWIKSCFEWSTFSSFFFSETKFTECMSLIKSTCGSVEITPRVSQTTYVDCENACIQDNNCKFVFYIPGSNCLKYPSCDKKRHTGYVGSTYSKDGYCPGSKHLLF